ncbi:MAG TPA: ABC transporter permease [Chloroflexota bacterium]|nr:ABC transporter permease [Chloroflexota bacterium]
MVRLMASTAPDPSAVEEIVFPRSNSGWRGAVRGFAGHKASLLGLTLTVLMLAAAILAPLISPHDPTTQFTNGLSLEGGPKPPGGPFLLGTDDLGRDLLSRLIWGARTSLEIAILSNIISGVISVAVGAFAGYLGGRIDMLLMRLTDMLMAIPAMLLAAFLAAVFRPSIGIIIIIVGFVNWFYLARIVRAEVMAQRRREFVDAARAIGLSPPRILLFHVLPQVWGLVIVYSTLNVATTVLFVASLSYVGIGVQQPTADWGNMISDGSQYLSVAPWLVIFPGIVLGISILGFNLLGDGLRDALDPRH